MLHGAKDRLLLLVEIDAESLAGKLAPVGTPRRDEVDALLSQSSLLVRRSSLLRHPLLFVVVVVRGSVKVDLPALDEERRERYTPADVLLLGCIEAEELAALH